MEPVDLRRRVELGLAHIRNSVDRARHCRPYFRFNLTRPPVWSRHEEADSPHTVGRFLHALAVCRPIAGVPDDPELLAGLRDQLCDCFTRGDGFAWDDEGAAEAHMHHQREALLGLVALEEIFQDGRSLEQAKALVRAMEKATRTTGTYPGAGLTADGWQRDNFPPTTSGRVIGALLAYARLAGDEVGVDLARRFARQVLATSFTEDGFLTPAAGTHIHSLTGTVASLVELGLATGEEGWVERARRVYEVGLLPFRMATGWVKESTRATRGRGEANCTADLIEAACLLGDAGHIAYFETAECMLRNHLLASQLLELSWVPENEGLANTHTHAHEDLRGRARGAFCFGEPNGFHSYNADLTGAALQGIAVAWSHICARREDTCRVHLLLSREDETVRLVSHLPREGRLEIGVRRSLELSVRVPPWVERGRLRGEVDGEEKPLAVEGDYARLGRISPDRAAVVRFPLPEYITGERELGNPIPYRVRWRGNAVTAMSGPGRWMPFYPELDG